VVHRQSDGKSTRVNNLLSYAEVNRQVLASLPPRERASSELIDPKASISADSLLGNSTRVAERATVKKSIIGSHCVIGKNSRVMGCVIGDFCTIGEGAKLDGCILSKHTRVGEKVELVKCQTQAGLEVDDGDKLKGEKLEITTDWAGNAGAGSGESDEDEEGGESDEDEDEDEED